MTVAQQQFPRLDAPMVTATGTPTTAFGQLLLNFWTKLGGSSSISARAAFISLDGSGSALPADLFRSSDGKLLGSLQIANIPGSPAQKQDVGKPPFTFIASRDGTIVVFAAEVELSRDSGSTWYKVTLNGGAIPLLIKDQVRVTWFSDNQPEVTFFPIAGPGGTGT